MLLLAVALLGRRCRGTEEAKEKLPRWEDQTPIAPPPWKHDVCTKIEVFRGCLFQRNEHVRSIRVQVTRTGNAAVVSNLIVLCRAAEERVPRQPGWWRICGHGERATAYAPSSSGFFSRYVRQVRTAPPATASM